MIEKPKKNKKRRRKVSKKVELLKAVLILIIIAGVIRLFIYSPYKVSDSSMLNSLYPGDYLLSSKISYRFGSPKAGDLIVFAHPFRQGESLISRIIATEGQKVEISGKTIIVDNQPINEYPNIQHSDYRILPPDFSDRDYMPAIMVPPGHVFVLSDNRDQTEDSRNYGAVDVNFIEGKATFVYFSWAPDPNAPKMRSPYITPAIQIFFYNLINFSNRVRWDRLFTSS